uniref:mitogen-activated protein kinase kinase n=1 Tax=Plasmodiophora brassicae TaxID=37360 RepID=A0A2L2BM66_PLABS|nr:MAPKK1 [Plasmodiophora brassicae]
MAPPNTRANTRSRQQQPGLTSRRQSGRNNKPGFRRRRPPALCVDENDVDDVLKSQVRVAIRLWNEPRAFVIGDFQIDGKGFTLGPSVKAAGLTSLVDSSRPVSDADVVDGHQTTRVDIQISGINELEVFAVCGVGSTSRVRIVRHKATRQLLALKQVDLDTSAERVQPIIAELRALHECNSPSIVSFHGAFYSNSCASIVMEYMDSGSLKDLATRSLNSSIPEYIISAIAKQILHGLVYLHCSKGIIHRDLKPSNILLNSMGRVKLADFGVSGKVSNVTRNRHTFVGTVSYMSPERIMGENHTVSSDIWSFGITLMECALGYFPFTQTAFRSRSKPAFWDMLDTVSTCPTPRLPGNMFSNEFNDFVSSWYINNVSSVKHDILDVRNLDCVPVPVEAATVRTFTFA